MSLQNELDNIFSTYIRLKESDDRGWGVCFICGRPLYWKYACNGHYIKSRYKGTKWNEKNCHMICYECNQSEENSLDLMTKHANKLIAKYGEGIINELAQLKQIRVKYSPSELKEKIKYYQQEVNRLMKEKCL